MSSEPESMQHPILIGQRLYLRPLEESDIGEDYVGWLNDFDVTRYLETGVFPSTAESIRQYLDRFQDSTTDIIFAIVDCETGQHIGNVTLNRIDWVHRTADTGLMIGRKEFWGKGYATEAWSLVVGHAFQRLGLRKITAGVVDDNKASLTALQKVGFQIEGRLRDGVWCDGQFRDKLLMGLQRDECLPHEGHSKSTKKKMRSRETHRAS